MKIPLKFKKCVLALKKYPLRQSFIALKFLPQVFSRVERIILLIFSALIIFSVSLIGINSWLQGTKVIPQYGGTMREGIVGESKDLDKHLGRLLNVGLTKYDSQKNIIGDMAQSWDINEEGKVYVFHLRPNFNSEDLANKIISRGIWKDIEISTPDEQTLTFTFKQPFSPFLYTSTEPIFEYGPYRIFKESKTGVELTAREDYFAGKPFIDKIVFKFYQSESELLRAARRGEIDAFVLNQDQPVLENFQKFEIKLPRDLILFFNLSRKDLQDINIRRALKEGASPGKTLELRLITSDNSKNVELAKSIVAKWSKNGVKVNLEIKDNIDLQKNIIPKRDYDVLLYGLDYGEDPDPYPFWHSSQIKEDGKNLSSFKNAKGDKLLEEARQEFDFSKREEKYNEFQKILDVETPMFVVEHQNLSYQISRDIRGVDGIVGSSETDRFLNITQWYINTKRVKK